jgi:hypothetical protein
MLIVIIQTAIILIAIMLGVSVLIVMAPISQLSAEKRSKMFYRLLVLIFLRSDTSFSDSLTQISQDGIQKTSCELLTTFFWVGVLYPESDLWPVL